MTSIFEFFTSLGDKLKGESLQNPDFVDYYRDYFQATNVCSSIFFVGLVVSLLTALVFYFVICNKSYALAKRTTWLAILVLIFFGITSYSVINIVGDDSDDPANATCLFEKSYKTEEIKLDITDDEDTRSEIQQTAIDYREQFKSTSLFFIMDESLPLEMGLVNGAFAGLFFLIFSLVIVHTPLKKFTINGAGIPF